MDGRFYGDELELENYGVVWDSVNHRYVYAELPSAPEDGPSNP